MHDGDVVWFAKGAPGSGKVRTEFLTGLKNAKFIFIPDSFVKLEFLVIGRDFSVGGGRQIICNFY